MEKNKLGVGNSRTNRKINIRKQRSDKKVDIRVPASREEREFAQYQARIKRESMTSYCSNLVTDKLNRYYYFEDIPYTHEDYILHVKVDQVVYERIVKLSVSWKCSIREATHRILINAFHFERQGI